MHKRLGINGPTNLIYTSIGVAVKAKSDSTKESDGGETKYVRDHLGFVLPTEKEWAGWPSPHMVLNAIQPMMC